MTSPVACLATAATATTARRPAMLHSSLAAAAATTTTGKRALSISCSSASLFATVRPSSNPTPTPPTCNSKSHTASSSSPLPSLENIRRQYSSMQSSGRTSILGNASSVSITNSYYYTPNNTNTTTRRNNKNNNQHHHQQQQQQQHLLLAITRPFSSASKRDFYEVLGVGKGADKGEVKKAYFKLAKQYHPDTNQVRAKKNGTVHVVVIIITSVWHIYQSLTYISQSPKICHVILERQKCCRKIQRGHGSLRGPLGRQTATTLRFLRPRGCRSEFWWRAGWQSIRRICRL